MMVSTMLLIHVLVCVLLVMVTLMQRGKGAGLSGVFGGGATQSVFGGRGAAPMLAKATIILAVLFMVSSFSLTLMSGARRAPASAIEREMRSTPLAPVEEGVAPLVPIEEEPAEEEAEPTGDQ
jgi:preprotein translocase subunit SecG